MRRCCRPRLLVGAAAAAAVLYGWYAAMLFVFDSDPAAPAAGQIHGQVGRPQPAARTAPLETHLLDDAEAVAPVEQDEQIDAAAPQQPPPQQLQQLRASEWRACGEKLLRGPARRQYAAAAKAATAASAPDVELVFSLVTNSPSKTIRRVIENLLAFSGPRSWVAVHLGKHPPVPYDKRDPDYRWLLAQAGEEGKEGAGAEQGVGRRRVALNGVRLGTTPHHGSELWAHMHNYRLAQERQQQAAAGAGGAGGGASASQYFVFASELQTLLRPGLEQWISTRRASIPAGGVPIVLPGQARLFEDTTRWHEIRPASW